LDDHFCSDLEAISANFKDSKGAEYSPPNLQLPARKNLQMGISKHYEMIRERCQVTLVHQALSIDVVGM